MVIVIVIIIIIMSSSSSSISIFGGTRRPTGASARATRAGSGPSSTSRRPPARSPESQDMCWEVIRGRRFNDRKKKHVDNK